MPPAARKDDVCSGHGCFPARPIIVGSGNVIINGKAAARVDDALDSHTCVSTHSGMIAAGSGTVKINGKKAARIGDEVDCGSVIAAGSGNVFIGG